MSRPVVQKFPRFVQCTLLGAVMASMLVGSSAFAVRQNVVLARQAFTCGGPVTSGGKFRQFASVGQPITETFHSPGKVIISGLWGVPDASACCQGSTGNVDCDPSGEINIADLTALVDFLFVSNAPLCCRAEANVVRDNVIDVSDLTSLVDFLFIDFKPTSLCRSL